MEFAAGPDVPYFGRAQPVSYSTRFPTVDYFATSKDEQAGLVFLVKAEHWSYEKEWRIVDVEKGAGVQRYPRESLTGIIFGCETTKKDKQTVGEWLARGGMTPQLYQARRCEHAYELVIENDRLSA